MLGRLVAEVMAWQGSVVLGLQQRLSPTPLRILALQPLLPQLVQQALPRRGEGTVWAGPSGGLRLSDFLVETRMHVWYLGKPKGCFFLLKQWFCAPQPSIPPGRGRGGVTERGVGLGPLGVFALPDNIGNGVTRKAWG